MVSAFEETPERPGSEKVKQIGGVNTIIVFALWFAKDALTKTFPETELEMYETAFPEPSVVIVSGFGAAFTELEVKFTVAPERTVPRSFTFAVSLSREVLIATWEAFCAVRVIVMSVGERRGETWVLYEPV